MILATVIVLLVFSLLFHEIGHAVAMHHRGVTFEKIGLGFSVPFLPRLLISFPLKRYNTVFELRPIPLGAYVKPTPEGQRTLEKLAYNDSAVVNGAGIWANFFLSWLLFIVVGCITAPVNLAVTAVMLAALACAYGFYLARRFFCRYIVLTLGFSMLVMLLWTLIRHPVLNAISGPIGIVREAKENTGTWEMGIAISCTLSLAIGLFNCLPLYPLDGGRIITDLLKTWKVRQSFQDGFKLSGFLAVLLLGATAIISDIVKLF